MKIAHRKLEEFKSDIFSNPLEEMCGHHLNICRQRRLGGKNRKTKKKVLTACKKKERS